MTLTYALCVIDMQVVSYDNNNNNWAFNIAP